MSARWASDARGGLALAVAGVVGVTDVVERLHATIAATRAPLGAPHRAPARGIAGFVYRRVRGVARTVGLGLDQVLAPFSGGETPDSVKRDHVVAALNGVLGDRLDASGNPLALPMRIRPPGDDEAPRSRIALFLHGLCMHDRHWPRDAGSADATVRALGYSPLYLHYNTGLAIADNGARLSVLLDELVARWPVPGAELVFVGHSMGGLVARSAHAHACRHDAPWRRALRAFVFLGTPHRGAALERAGKRIDHLLGISPYTAPFAALGAVRSAGIRDLGHGDIGHGDRLALPEGVRAHAIAGNLRLGSDGLVTVDSALGRPGFGLGADRLRVIDGAGHLDLMQHPRMVDGLARWLRTGG